MLHKQAANSRGQRAKEAGLHEHRQHQAADSPARDEELLAKLRRLWAALGMPQAHTQQLKRKQHLREVWGCGCSRVTVKSMTWTAHATGLGV
eukprot:366094-Chlamydomonas_euryale.AAC.2